MPDDWQLQGVCRGMDPEIFYPSVAARRDFNRPHPQAIRACAVCPVKDECYLHALRKEDYGFWAGTTEQERRKLRKAAGIHLEKNDPFDFWRITYCGTPAGVQKHYRKHEKPCQACREASNRKLNGYETQLKLVQ